MLKNTNKKPNPKIKTVYESESGNIHIGGIIPVLAEDDSWRQGNDKDVALRYLAWIRIWKMSSTTLLILPVAKSDVLLLSVSIWRELDSVNSRLSIHWCLAAAIFLLIQLLQSARNLHANTFSSRSAIYLDRDKAQNWIKPTSMQVLKIWHWKRDIFTL